MILAILQARTSSSRLPGKVIKEILGKPMIIRQIERILKSEKIGKLILATSTDSSDDALEEICKINSTECFRGDLNDVLKRFYFAADKYKPENVVRLTGDCPVIDPEIIDKTINYHISERFDYTTNALEPTFPDGLDVEIMKFSVLKQAFENAELTSQREHVTPYIYNNPDKFKIGILKNTEDLSNLRWTVDEKEDYDFITKIYDGLYRNKPDFNMNDIINFMESNSDLCKYNSKFKRNEGYEKSLKSDKPHLL